MSTESALVALLEHIGIEVARIDGDEIRGRCPAHPHWEHRPRHWSINANTGRHHCFSCEYGGSLTKLVMDQTRLGLWDATKLIKGYEIEFSANGSADRWLGDTETVSLAELRHQFDTEFRLTLPERALERRHITQQACEDYEVRHHDGVPGWVLPVKYRGTVYGWQLKPFDARHPWFDPLDVPMSHCLFGFDRLDAARVILVESPLDVLYLHSLGYRYSAVASFGCHVSDEQMDLLVRSPDILELVVALDHDEAGWKGVQSILDRGWHKSLPMYLFDYGDALGKDPGELSPEEIERGLAQTKHVPARRQRLRGGRR